MKKWNKYFTLVVPFFLISVLFTTASWADHLPLIGSIADGVPEELEKAVFYIKKENYNRSRTMINAFLKKYPNHVKGKVLLFYAIYKQKLHERAEPILNEILDISREEAYLFLAAHFYFDQKNYPKSRQFLEKILYKNKRHTGALRLLAAIHQQEGYNAKAGVLYREIEMINPENENWLYDYALFLNKTENPKSDIILKKYYKLYPESPKRFFLHAGIELNNKNYNKAETFIRKALFYKPEKNEYKKRLFKIILESQNYKKALKILKQEKPQIPLYYYLEAFLEYKNQEKYPFKNPFVPSEKSSFEINDTNTLTFKIFPLLEKSVSFNEANEAAYFFKQFLLLDNFYSTSHLRKELALKNFHHYQLSYKSGDTRNYLSWLIQALTADPLNPDYRRELAAFYKSRGFLHSYLEELKILNRIYEKTNFVLQTKVEINEKEIKKTLQKKYNLKPNAPAGRVFLSRIDLKSPYSEIPGIEKIFSRIFKTHLNFCGNITTENNSYSPFKTTAFINLRLADKEINAEMKIFNPQVEKNIFEKKYVYEGNHKLHKLSLEMTKDIENRIPLYAMIKTIREKNVIISAGKRNNITTNGVFRLTAGSHTNTFFKIAEIDEYFCRCYTTNRPAYQFLKPSLMVIYEADKP